MRVWLIEARKRADMTQRELAGMANISQNHYSAIENGSRRPSPEVSKILANALGLNWVRFYDEHSERRERAI